MKGEDTRCFAPWAGHDPAPHEPWPAQHTKAARRNLPRLVGVAPNLAMRRRPQEDRRPLAEPRSRSIGFGKPTPEAFGAGSGCRQLGQPKGRPRRLRQKRLPGWGGIARTRPPRPPEPPEGAPGTAPMLARSPRAAAPSGVPKGAPPTRIGAPLPRREGASFPAEEHGGAQAGRILRAGGGKRPGPHSTTAAEPRSRLKDRNSPDRHLPRELSPPSPGPRRPLDGESFALADDPALSRGK